MLVSHWLQSFCYSHRNLLKKKSSIKSTSSTSSSPSPDSSFCSVDVEQQPTQSVRQSLRKKNSLHGLPPEQLLSKVENHIEKEFAGIGARLVRQLLEEAAENPEPYSFIEFQFSQTYMEDSINYDYHLSGMENHFVEIGGSKLANFKRVRSYRHDLRIVKIKITENELYLQMLSVGRKDLCLPCGNLGSTFPVSLIEVVAESEPEATVAKFKTSASAPVFSTTSVHLVSG